MKEYEYSFRVEYAEAYHAFCIKSSPDKISVQSLRRRVYKDGSLIIARITEEEDEGKSRIYFDFKEDTIDSTLIKHVKESPEMEVDEANLSEVEKLLSTLGFALSIDLDKKRTRYHYKGMHIDIDEYTSPEAAVVVEIEGIKESVDKMYQEMQYVLPESEEL